MPSRSPEQPADPGADSHRASETDPSAYELAPAPVKPRLPGTVIVRTSVDELIDAVAADLYIHAVNCVRAFGDFHAAFSGGSTPLPLYTQLMVDPAYRQLPWQRTHLWMAEERRVAFDDDRSAFKQVRETIVDHSDIPPNQVHPIFPLADDADTRYERELRETLAWREKGHDRLDFTLLSLGAGGNTAGLFPGSGAVGENTRLVRLATDPRVPAPGRVTLTLPMINASRFIAVIATGARKRAAVERIAVGRETPAELPIMGVRPLGGELRWYLDHDACPA